MTVVFSELLLDGMTGKYCVHLIKTTLDSMKGIQSTEVDFRSKKVLIGYSPELVPLSIIIQRILALGYSICGFREPGFLRKVV